jgi:hypothetical protein
MGVPAQRDRHRRAVATIFAAPTLKLWRKSKWQASASWRITCIPHANSFVLKSKLRFVLSPREGLTRKSFFMRHE